MTNRRRIALAAVLLSVAFGGLSAPASGQCEIVLCPEYWDWDWSICGCACTSELCCDYYGHFYNCYSQCCQDYPWRCQGCWELSATPGGPESDLLSCPVGAASADAAPLAQGSPSPASPRS